MAQQVKKLPTMQETQEMQVQSLGQEDPLEKETATHSSILPQTEEAGRLQSKESERVRHNWVTSTHTHMKNSTPSVFGKCELKPGVSTDRQQQLLSGRAVIKKTDDTKCWWECGETGTLVHFLWECNWSLSKTKFSSFQKD